MYKASDAVKDYLGKYNNLDDSILVELDELVKEEDLTDDESEKYKEIMKKQYQDLKYEIVDEEYNGDEAVVTAKITVYDLYKVQKEALEYKNNHTEEFLDSNGLYDANLYLDYKLEQMEKNDTKVEYTIDFKVIKKDGKWTVEEVSTEDLEKIHGIYNYEND
jgi:hypothetical protein